jgi:hypothetical protein
VIQHLRHTLIIIVIILGCHTFSFSQDSLKINKDGIYTGIHLGTWLPDNKNKVLGHPSIFGFTLDFKLDQNALGLNFDLIGVPYGKTKNPVTIKFGDSTIVRNEFAGVHITLEYARSFYTTKHFVFEGIAGIGYGQLSYYNPDAKTNIEKASLVINPGISIRYLIKRKTYIQLKTQYCFANYQLNDNVSTSFKGNYFITKLVIGRLTYNN